MIRFDTTVRIDRLILQMILAVVWLSPVLSFGPVCCSAGEVSESDKIDFAEQIVPILQAKCVSCHGPMMANGGLRLDRKAGVETGGYSQMPLLGGTLETNEIYLRVASKDPAFRMPKGMDPLTAEELALIKGWVEQGTPWKDTKQPQQQQEVDWFDYDLWMNYLERWLLEVPGFIPWLIGNLGIMLFLWFVERYKQAAQKGSAWTGRRWSRWLSPLRGFGLTHFLLVAVTMGWTLTLLVSHGQSIKIKSLAQAPNAPQSANASTSPMINSVYGNPPTPQHPGHPARLRGEYYRGNCERNAKLFNGGNYRTGTLRVSLVDSQGHDVNYGDRVDSQNLAIRFELDRPQGTTPVLYGDNIAKSVYLTTQLIPETLIKLEQPVTRLTETKPGWKWEATVPLKLPQAPTTTVHSGLIYVYHGAIDKNKARGSLHYGIKYDLKLKESILQPDSQVWMGSLFWTPTIEHPSNGKVPLKEWFDDEPIPEMTGENTTDPELLGIPEHEEKRKANM